MHRLGMIVPAPTKPHIIAKMRRRILAFVVYFSVDYFNQLIDLIFLS